MEKPATVRRKAALYGAQRTEPDWLKLLASIFLTETQEAEMQSKTLFDKASKKGISKPTILRHLRRLESIELIQRRVQTSDLTVFYKLDFRYYFLSSALVYRPEVVEDGLETYFGFVLCARRVLSYLLGECLQVASFYEGKNAEASIDIFNDYIIKPAINNFQKSTLRALRDGSMSGQQTRRFKSIDKLDIGDEKTLNSYIIRYTAWWSAWAEKSEGKSQDYLMRVFLYGINCFKPIISKELQKTDYDQGWVLYNFFLKTQQRRQ